VPGAYNTGSVVQASKAEEYYASELGFANSQPSARWVDANGQTVQLTSPTRLAGNTPAVIAMTSVPGAQRLRVNTAVVASTSATMGPGNCAQMLLGWGFLGHYPRGGFNGNLYSAIAGKGALTTAELAVLERYLGTTAGITL